MKRVFWSRLLSRPVQFALDVVALAAAFTLSYLLRFEFHLAPPYLQNCLAQLPLVVLVELSALFLAGVYTFIWRYVGIAELTAFLKALAGSAAVLVAARLALPRSLALWRVPLSVIVMDTVLGFGLVLGLRVIRRMLYERFERVRLTRSNNGPPKPVLLIGAGRAGVLAAREIQGRGDMGIEVKGFVDDDPEKVGASVHGVRVLGPTEALPRLVRRYGIDHVIITIAQAPRKELKRIVEICDRIPIPVRIIPGLYEILEGRVEISRIRKVEIEDLLGREPVQLEAGEVAGFLRGKIVMVTGAGGSIGSELARQVARFEPARLLLVERAEFALFDIHRDLQRLHPKCEVSPLVADICDEPRMRSLMTLHRPHVVIHAAAHKHVPMMESNPVEAVKNNALGTHLVGSLAGEHGAEAFVLISTDKAVRPTSVMGASKRVAELVIQDLNSRYDTRFVAVRFGNVLGSAGSVIPIFREQIRRGGPVTVTHPDMKRYFMTIPEAAQLVLQAGAMGRGGEIFILDMGEPVRIMDLAQDMIRLSGLQPHEDIEIVITGVRPGEKLFEELETTGEHITKTRHPKIFIGRVQPYPADRIERALGALRELSRNGRDGELRSFLNELLPEASLQV